MLDFLSLRIYDILDILLVAFLIFLIYRLIKGTVAFNIVVGFLLVYLVYVIVRALHMELLTTIIGQFIGVGVL
ncbi:MAG TPA: TIGR00159 family protein, partial [Prolixibacteraceae bacterium]|nr:TIGR00159 family protein [Prolixibacteraceae bacterium]